MTVFTPIVSQKSIVSNPIISKSSSPLAISKSSSPLATIVELMRYSGSDLYICVKEADDGSVSTCENADENDVVTRLLHDSLGIGINAGADEYDLSRGANLGQTAAVLAW